MSNFYQGYEHDFAGKMIIQARTKTIGILANLMNLYTICAMCPTAVTMKLKA